MTAQEEGEIKEAFGLFAEPMDGEKNGVLPIRDLKSTLMYGTMHPPPYTASFAQKKCSLMDGGREREERWDARDGEGQDKILTDTKIAILYRALGIPPSSTAELREFVAILDPDSDGFATYEPFFAICALKFHAREHSSDSHRSELDEAFQLFTNGQDGPITLAHLRRVAAVLKEDLDEDLLKDMILEANGGAGVARGVELDEFDGVMRSAGVWR